MEIKTEVKTYRVEMQCDKCNDGRMEYTGIGMSLDPAIYQHRCNKCDYMICYTNKKYPHIIEEPI
jgi:hypothetical protein